MREEHEKKIKEIMTGMECPRDFACYELDFNPRCKVKEVELDNHLEIEGEYDYSCKYLVISRGLGYTVDVLFVFISPRQVSNDTWLFALDIVLGYFRKNV